MKTLDLLGLDDGDELRRYPLEGVAVEVRYFSDMFRCVRWQVLVSLFILSTFNGLLCKRTLIILYWFGC